MKFSSLVVVLMHVSLIALASACNQGKIERRQVEGESPHPLSGENTADVSLNLDRADFAGLEALSYEFTYLEVKSSSDISFGRDDKAEIVIGGNLPVDRTGSLVLTILSAGVAKYRAEKAEVVLTSGSNTLDLELVPVNDAKLTKLTLRVSIAHVDANGRPLDWDAQSFGGNAQWQVVETR